MNGTEGTEGTQSAEGAGGTDRNGGLRAHIGSFTSGGGRGITTAAVDPRTG
ncbi:hypothetical protein GTW69_00905, partial [Streptomyces sp. SID7760]|nr:hypothetical protein [Streptomyces sp. SID7760]